MAMMNIRGETAIREAIEDECVLVSKSLSGFTLIELLITIAVGTILLTTAVPSFKEVIANNRMATQVNSLVTALNLARSEAIKRGVRVTVCKSANSASATPSCSSAANWDSGWMVFVDGNGSGTCADGDSDGICDSNGAILRASGPVGSGDTLRTGDNYANWVAYLPSGVSQGSAGLSDIFRLCDDRGTASARSISISVAGRINTSVGTAVCP